MKARYIGDYYKVRYIKGKIYDVYCDDDYKGYYFSVDETGDEGYVPIGMFEIVDKTSAYKE